MFRLYADIEIDNKRGWGETVLQVLREQYPDQDVTGDPMQIGGKMYAIALKQLQNDPQKAADALQTYMTKILGGSKYETDRPGHPGKYRVDESGEPVLDDDGKPIPDEAGERILRVTPQPFDFTTGANTWKDALLNMNSNIKNQAKSLSMGEFAKMKKEKSIDDAFGRRTDDGGSEGGEGRMPTPSETALGQGLDDASALKEFYNLMDKHIPELKASMSEDSRALFELIFDEEIGGFGGDIKENMGQATKFREEKPEVWERFIEGPGAAVADDEKKLRLKWSAFVGKLRKNVLKELWDYINDSMKMKDFKKLQDEFFSDYDPSAQERQIEEKAKGKADYQSMRDENAVARLKAEGKSETDTKLKKLREKIGDTAVGKSDFNQELYDALKADEKSRDEEDALTEVEVKQLKELKAEREAIVKKAFDAIKPDASAGAAGKRKKKDDEAGSEAAEAGDSASSATASVVAAAFHLAASSHRPIWSSPGV